MIARRRVPFAVFWVVALLSNLTAAAQSVAVLWALGDTALPPVVLLVYQISGVIGTFIGIAVGGRLVVRLGHRRCIVVSSTLEGVACLAVAAAALSGTGTFTNGQALVVALLMCAFPFAAGIGGPAWIALTSRWPGTSDATRQLLLDSTQFQAGRFVGPLVGAAVLAATVYAVQVVSIFNALTCAAVVGIMLLLRPGPEDVAEPRPRTSWRSASLRWIRVPAVWGIAVLALSGDAARVYLPRFVREQGDPQIVYSATVSALALAAVVSAAAASKIRLSDRTLGVVSLVATAAALLVWSASSALGGWTWILGGALIGCGVSLGSASLTNSMMTEAGEGHAAAAAGTGMVVRTGVGALGGVLLASIAGLGALAYLPFGLIAILGTAAYVARTR